MTSDITTRLRAHNAGQNRATAAWRPWLLDVCIEFRGTVMRFEKYLGSGTGHAFASHHVVAAR